MKRFITHILVTALTALSLAGWAHGATLALFSDGRYVDDGPFSDSEATNLKASLEELGHSVATFTGTNDTDFSAALAGADALVIPELENADLAPDLPPDTQTVVSNFVAAGGGFILNGHIGDRDEDLVNLLFGFSITFAGADLLGAAALSTNAAGSAFSGGPTNILYNQVTPQWLTADLPSGTGSIYSLDFFGTDYTSVALIPFGMGQVAFLAFDWFDAAPQGEEDHGWLEVLDRAVEEVKKPIPAGRLRFESTSHSVAEDAVAVTVTVTRVEGTTGAVSVDYTTVDDTATAGTDYTAASDTLSFADGDAETNIVVLITDNGDPECSRDFLIQLGSPTGGAVINGPTNATVQIVDDEAGLPQITTASLPDAQQFVAYSNDLVAVQGVSPYTWSSELYTETGEANGFSAGGTAQGWNDDDEWWTLALPFSFPFYGSSYTECFVDSNGRIRLDFGDSDFDESIESLADGVIIAVIWDDLDTSGSGADIHVTSSSDEVTVRWAANYLTDESAVNAQVTLDRNGKIRMQYGVDNLRGGLIGVSAGNNTDYLVSRFSKSGGLGSAADIIFHPFPGGMTMGADGDLTGSPSTSGTNAIRFVATDTCGYGTNRIIQLVIVGDRDADGMPDEWETNNGLDPDDDGTTDVNNGAAGNPDTDRVTNWEEYVADTHPTNGMSQLLLIDQDRAPTQEVSFDDSSTSRKYRLVYKEDLTSEDWVPATTYQVGAGGMMTIPDPGASSELQRFYQVDVDLLP